MRINTKPTIYLIDGLNFVRGFLYRDFDSEEHKTEKFLNWLENVSKSEFFQRSQFRVIFDGVYRSVGHTIRGNLTVSFSDDVKADELILEQAVYLKSEGKRVIVVTGDVRLGERIRMEKVKAVTCDKFYDICESAITAI
jgi:hypothetical protein